MPKIYVPLKALRNCNACGSAANLRLCSQCAESAYCSTDCQKSDWKTHKATCKTDRIDLASFYPVMACIIDATHVRMGGAHPALTHKIINAPNPYTPATLFPDGTHARAVALGRPLNMANTGHDSRNWWPQGLTAEIRAKLMRRIMREGNVLPAVVSCCLSLLLSIYSTTTTENATGLHRVRLRYRSSPISDFGVVAGCARITPEDQLAYILPDKTILRGQDPDDHYWIYFQTVRGEEVVLDCNLFTFNFCWFVKTDAYTTSRTAFTDMPYVPVMFKDRALTRGLPAGSNLLTERRRFPVLHDDALRAGIEKISVTSDGNASMHPSSANAIRDFMEKVAGRRVTDSQFSLCTSSMVIGMNIILDATVRTDAWKKYPEDPQMGFERDPLDADPPDS